MGEIIVFLLAWVFILIGWGFWPFIGILAAWILIVWMGKPKYSFETNWANIFAKLGVIGLSFFAIHNKWDDPVITAISIATALILFFAVR